MKIIFLTNIMYTIDGSYKFNKNSSKKLIEGMDSPITTTSTTSTTSPPSSTTNSNNFIVPKTEMQTIIENIYLKLENMQNIYRNEMNTLVNSVNEIKNNYVKYSDDINIENGTNGVQLLKRFDNNTAFVGDPNDRNLSELQFKITKPN